jgi:hypothetical protein
LFLVFHYYQRHFNCGVVPGPENRRPRAGLSATEIIQSPKVLYGLY